MIQVVEGLVNLVPRVLSYPPYGCLSLRRAVRREPWERGWGLVLLIIYSISSCRQRNYLPVQLLKAVLIHPELH